MTQRMKFIAMWSFGAFLVTIGTIGQYTTTGDTRTVFSLITITGGIIAGGSIFIRRNG